MTHHVSRRNILRLGAATAVLPWLPQLAPGAANAEAPAAGAALAAAALHPFKLSDVSLGQGVFARKRELILNFARGYDERRYLNVFRANAGLQPEAGVVPLPAGGWEGLDGEANGNLRGHFTGHHMSMLAQAYAGTGEEIFGTRLRNLVASLHECRGALSREPVIQATGGRLPGTAVDIARGSYVYGQLPAGSVDGLTALTFAAWVRPTAAANWARIFDFGNDTRTYAFLAQRDGAGLPRFAITRNFAGGEQTIVGTAPLPVNEWSHVAVTLDGRAGTLYVNGRQAGRNNTLTLTPALLGSLANVWLGRSQYNDPTFAGAYQDVNVWSSALSAAQVADLAAAPASNTSAGNGDVVSLACGESSGSVLADASGKGRNATLRRTWGLPSHPGYLAAYPETQFIELESRTTPDYLRVWAPYYTAHKILKGLLDAYTATAEPKALDLAAGLCDWMHSRLSKLTPAVRQRMWGIFSSGEYGGVVEAILETHGHTGKPEHLELAKYFDLDSLIDACAQNKDILAGLHANQHIPIFTGLVLMYNATGEERYLTAARNFWSMVVPTRMFSIGGTSQGEFWKERDRIAAFLNATDAESCCAYNMLKLSRELFFKDRNPAYMDYYERALFNQVLGSKQDRERAELPLATYFIGLQPGAVRDFTPKQGTTCCEGTGLESATKYQDSVYFTTADGSALYVNLYIPSTLRWAAKNITVTQKTSSPSSSGQRCRWQAPGSSSCGCGYRRGPRPALPSGSTAHRQRRRRRRAPTLALPGPGEVGTPWRWRCRSCSAPNLPWMILPCRPSCTGPSTSWRGILAANFSRSACTAQPNSTATLPRPCNRSRASPCTSPWTAWNWRRSSREPRMRFTRTFGAPSRPWCSGEWTPAWPTQHGPTRPRSLTTCGSQPRSPTSQSCCCASPG